MEWFKDLERKTSAVARDLPGEGVLLQRCRQVATLRSAAY